MFLLWTSFFLLGCSTINVLPTLPSLWWLSSIVILNLLLFAFTYGYIKKVILLSLGFYLGLFWSVGYSAWLLSSSLGEDLVGKTQTITGTIVSIPNIGEEKSQFIFEDQERKILLSWFGRHPKLTVGDKWQFSVRLKKPHGQINPGGFDYEKWLFSQRILATGYIVNSAGNMQLVQDHGFYLIDRMRQNISEQMSVMQPQDKMLRFIKALTIGEKSEVTTSQWIVLSKTGTNHLLAISGLHIGLVAGLIFFFTRLLWTRLGFGRWLAAPIAAAIAAILAAAGYSALAGFALPTQRALVMILVVMVSIILKRRVSLWHSFALALFLVLVLDPLASLTISFWLSFSAVLLLLYGLTGRLGDTNFWRKWVSPQWVIFIGLMPLLWFFFQQSSMIGFVANMIAIPWVSFVVVPLSLLAVAVMPISSFLSDNLLIAASFSMELLWPVLAYLADSKFAVWQLHKVHGLLFIALIIGSILFLAPRKLPGRWLLIIYFLPLFFLTPQKPAHGDYWVNIYDVGQGLSVMVRTREHTLVYDTGLPSTEVANFISAEQVKSLDTLIVSHDHSDHAGGVEKLVGIYPPDKFIGKDCNRKQFWEWDGVSFKIIYPKKNNQRGNNDSCVLLIDNGRYRVLLPGDIEKLAENELVRSYDDLKVDVVVAPHHGSNTSSTKQFVDATQPDYVIFATGYRNRYRFPSKKIVARYQAIQAKMFNTAYHGAIQLKLPQLADLTLTALRDEQRRIWRALPK